MKQLRMIKINSQMLLLFVLFTLVHATIPKHEFYIIELTKNIWDKPNQAKELLRSLDRDHKVKFWAALPNAQFIVSFDKYARSSRGRYLQSSPSFHLRNKPVILSKFSQTPKKVRIITCVDNVDIRAFLPFNSETVFHVHYDSSMQSHNNIAVLSFINSDKYPPLEVIDILSKVSSILSIEEVTPFKLHNFHAVHVGLSGKDTFHSIEPGLPKEFGSDTIITIGDTGLDTNHCFFSHPDFKVNRQYISRSTAKTILSRVQNSEPKHPRVLAYFAVQYEEDGSIYQTDFTDYYSGHGTHVAGSAVGGYLNPLCTSTPPLFNSKAKLIFFDFMKSTNTSKEEEGGLLIPPSLIWIMQTSYDLGSRIFSNSWGSDGNGYSLYSYQIDYFVHMNPDYVVLFSNGNDGPTSGTVGNPATMKNGISVGSSLNSNLAFKEYANKRFWEDEQARYNFTSTTALKIDQYCNEYSLSSFSSRGPTFDGRIKPDLVFPGEFILSSKAVPGASTPNAQMTLKRGTSMATPLIASLLSLIEERLKKVYHQIQPSASLKKAILISSTRTLANYSVDFHFDSSIGSISPSLDLYTQEKLYNEGFGRVVLDDFLHDRIAFKDNLEFFGFSKPQSFCFEVEKDSIDLMFTLVYTDVPTIGYFSNQTLINNLNLRLTLLDPTTLAIKNVFNGNGFNTLDSKNNVEVVRFSSVHRTLLHISIGANGPIVSLRPDRTQHQFASISYNSHLSQLDCSRLLECTDFSIPFECILENGDVGTYQCINFTYSNTCTPITTKTFIYSANASYSICPLDSNCSISSTPFSVPPLPSSKSRSLFTATTTTTTYATMTSSAHRVPWALYFFIISTTLLTTLLLIFHLIYTKKRFV